jgi:drug/metabolite transporter (DMT)-like permease
MIIGVIFVLLASLMCALYSKYNEFINEDVITKLFYQFIITIPLVYILLGNFQISDVMNLSIINWFYVFLLVFVISIGGYGFNIISINKVKSLKTGTLDFLEPIVGVSLAILIFKEAVSIIQVLGWIMILFTIINIRRIN